MKTLSPSTQHLFRKPLLRLGMVILCLFGLTLSAQNDNIFNDYIRQGHISYDSRNIDSTKFFITKLDSLLLLSPRDSSKYYQVQVLKSNIFLSENKKGDAIEMLLKAEAYFNERNDQKNLVFALYRLGVANYYVNRRDVSRQYLEEALTYSEFLSKRLETRIHQNLGTLNLEIGMNRIPKDTILIEKAVSSYKKAIQIFNEEHWLIEEALATSLLAECYNQLGDFDKALGIINRAIELATQADNKSQLGFALIKKSSILRNKNRLDEASETIEIAKPIFKELKDYPTLLYALTEQKKILTRLKKFEEATVVGDSIYMTSVLAYNTRFADKVSEMDAKYKTAEQEKELLDQELQLKNRNLLIIIVTSALIIILIVSVGLYQKQRFKRSQLQKEMDLKDSLALIKTQNRLQEQRLEISRDLHDNIGSQLTFIISSLDNLKYVSKEMSTKLKEKVASISSFTFDTIHQLRDTIWAMNKNQISMSDFYSRVLSYIEKVKTVKPDLQFNTSNTISDDVMFSSVEGMNLFRVIQESMNNVIKHSDADKIDLIFSQENNHLTFAIRDNGKGFDTQNFKAGNGLSNMESRIASINGEIFINSATNKGTEIRIKMNV